MKEGDPEIDVRFDNIEIANLVKTKQFEQFQKWTQKCERFFFIIVQIICLFNTRWIKQVEYSNLLPVIGMPLQHGQCCL